MDMDVLEMAIRELTKPLHGTVFAPVRPPARRARGAHRAQEERTSATEHPQSDHAVVWVLNSLFMEQAEAQYHWWPFVA
jgi:hypothetical protein